MHWQHFNGVDYVILGLLALSIGISFIRGFVRESLSLLMWVSAIWVAHRYYEMIADLFLDRVYPVNARLIVAFSVLFLLTLFVGAFINFLIGQIVVKTGLSGMDRVLGLGFGFIRGLLLVSVLILLSEATSFAQHRWWMASELIPQFSGMSDWLKGFVPEQLEQLNAVVNQNAKEGAAGVALGVAVDEAIAQVGAPSAETLLELAKPP